MSAMSRVVSRILPYPWMSVCLLAMWLLLNQSVAPGHLILGAVLAVAGGLMLSLLEPPRLRLRRPGLLFVLFGRVLVDIIRSNIAVSQIVLGPRQRRETSGFMTIPLALRDTYGLTMLALIVTCTPGTLWVEYNSRRGTLLLHVLDLIDEQTWLQIIKGRYESLLLEIFE